MVGGSAAQTNDGLETSDLRGRKDLCPEEEEEGAVVEVAGALSTGPGLAALGLGRSWQELVQAHAAGSLEGQEISGVLQQVLAGLELAARALVQASLLSP